MESDNIVKMPVKLKITGVQKDIDTEPVIQNVSGIFSRRGDSSYIRYTEEETGACMMKLTPSRVEIKRGGSNGPVIFFEKDGICRTAYNTPSGILEAEFRTEKLEYIRRPETGNSVADGINIMAHVEYLLMMNGERVSDCELEICVNG